MEPVSSRQQRERAKLFNEVPALYEQVRPSYPDDLFADLVAVTGVDSASSILEIGCGTGQATRSLAQLGCDVTAIEPGVELADIARQRTARFSNVAIETSTFEEWDHQDRRFDLVVAASSWHWIDPSIGWAQAHNLLHPSGWLALLGHVVVRRPDEPEVYAATADLHEQFAPGNPDWRHPPLEDEVRATSDGWGPPNDDRDGLFGPTVVRWYPTEQHFDGAGFANLLRTLSVYRQLDASLREPLLDAIAQRIRTDLGDHATRHYLTVLRAGQRTH
jgi:SAM-dependent methyltransferase